MEKTVGQQALGRPGKAQVQFKNYETVTFTHQLTHSLSVKQTKQPVEDDEVL